MSLKIKIDIPKDKLPNKPKVIKILAEVILDHIFRSIKFSLTLLKYIIYRLFVEKNVNILSVDQKIAKPAKSLTDNL